MKILIATNNQHKIQEITQVVCRSLPDKNIIFVSPSELEIYISPEEKYNTFEENARVKAVEFYAVVNIPVISDDSGLEIVALNGQPGVNSARFAGIHDDKANIAKVLYLLEAEYNRVAQFRTCICYYDGVNELYFNGICKGSIINEERGSNGFGYDPIFIPDGYDITFAEMNIETKNTLSHRYKALMAFCEGIRNI